MTTFEIFAQNIRIQGPPDECWGWVGNTDQDSMPYFTGLDGKKVRAARFSYEHHRGPILGGLHVKQACHSRTCCNPKHLILKPRGK